MSSNMPSSSTHTFRFHGFQGVRPIRAFAVALIMGFSVISAEASAQYYGEYESNPYLGRSGFIFVEMSMFNAKPGQDFVDIFGGAASPGSGWKIGVGSWFGPRFAGEFEWGWFSNDRFALYDPWYLRVWSNVTGMSFDARYHMVLIRYNMPTEKRWFPYVTSGLGRINQKFTVHFMDRGDIRQESRDGKAYMICGGLGLNYIVTRHTTILAEFRMMQWFSSWLIPNTRYWSLRRLGLGISWHY